LICGGFAVSLCFARGHWFNWRMSLDKRESGWPDIYQIRTQAGGPAGALPITDEMLLKSPSGDLFGLTQNAGMGWAPAEAGRKHFLILSTQGGLRASDGKPLALGYHTGHWEIGLLVAEAAEEFRKAVAAKPDSVIARINLGVTLSQLGDVQGAAEQFEEAIRIDPGRVNAHYNLAILLAGQGKHEQAIAHLQSALAVDPNDTSVGLLLGRELVKVGRCSEASELAAKLRTNFPCRPKE